MTGMRDAEVCWAPECGNVPAPSRGSRPSKYCSGRCRVKAVRRNGGTAPSEPYPPLEPWPTPLHQDAPGVTVAEQSEQQPAADVISGATGATAGRSSSDAAGKARKERRDSVQPPAVAMATAGKASAPTAPPQGAAVPPETAASTPRAQPGRKLRDGGVVPAGGVHAPSGSAGPGTPTATDTGASDPTGAASDGTAAALAEAPAASVTQLHVTVTEDATVPVKIVVHPMVAQYQRDLEQMGQAGTRQGLQALAMAEKLVSSATSPAAAATISKELDRLMAALEQNTPDAQVGRDPSVAIRERTIAKLRAVAEGKQESA